MPPAPAWRASGGRWVPDQAMKVKERHTPSARLPEAGHEVDAKVLEKKAERRCCARPSSSDSRLTRAA